MSRKYKFRNPDGIYFMSFAVKDWNKVFIYPQYANIFIDSIRYCQANKGLALFGWCLMPDHVHLIAKALANNHLSDIMRDLKKYSSKKIIKELTEDKEHPYLIKNFVQYSQTQFWEPENHPIEIYNQCIFDQKLNYLHLNPVKAGLVDSPEAYLYSSAINYSGAKGLLNVNIDLKF